MINEQQNKIFGQNLLTALKANFFRQLTKWLKTVLPIREPKQEIMVMDITGNIKESGYVAVLDDQFAEQRIKESFGSYDKYSQIAEFFDYAFAIRFRDDPFLTKLPDEIFWDDIDFWEDTEPVIIYMIERTESGRVNIRHSIGFHTNRKDVLEEVRDYLGISEVMENCDCDEESTEPEKEEDHQQIICTEIFHEEVSVGFLADLKFLLHQSYYEKVCRSADEEPPNGDNGQDSDLNKDIAQMLRTMR